MSIDINATDFVPKFDPAQATVGVIGYGYVGRAVEQFFRWKTDENGNPAQLFDTKVFDKAKPEMDTLADVVGKAEIIFVCVPTPMRKDGACHTGIVESVLKDILDEAARQDRSPNNFVVVVKSTVYPGFTDEMKKKYPLRLLFSPEFLTEKNSVQDFENTNRVLLGGDIEDGRVAFKFFEARLYEKLLLNQVVIVGCESKEAEMAKLFTNGILMTKVLFCNEMYQLCQKMGIDYEEVRTLATLDFRIGVSHTYVPGHDGSLGAGGHCFPKDINNLRNVCRQQGVPEKLFTAVIDRNNEIREDKDWEKMKDRAVIDE
jgi:UDPglucose 6-dehydrogenase